MAARLSIVTGVWLAILAVLALAWLGPAEGFRDAGSARIIVFHVPCAITASVLFLASAVLAAVYLSKRSPVADWHSAACVEAGLLFAVLATVTGSVFARLEWGSWWNNDPREVSIVVLILVYAAYLALRSSVTDQRRRASSSAAYALLSVPAMVYLVFVVPRVGFSLHPSSTISRGELGSNYGLMLGVSAVGLLAIASWLVVLRARLSAAESRERVGGGDAV